MLKNVLFYPTVSKQELVVFISEFDLYSAVRSSYTIDYANVIKVLGLLAEM